MDQSQNHQSNKSVFSNTSFILGLAIGVAVFSLAGLIMLLVSGNSLFSGSKDKTANTNSANVNSAPEKIFTVPSVKVSVSDKDHSLGNKNAKITLVEYSDFQCPYCASHYATVKNLEKRYGDDLRLIYRHFPLSFHEQARPAALASECAAEQGKFWEMHDKLFENNQSLSSDIYATLAKDINLDVDKFNDCVKSEKYASVISDDYSSGLKSGVNGTPATFIIFSDGSQKLISGARPEADFVSVIGSIK